MAHRIQATWKDRWRACIPFGLGLRKPKHFRDMIGVAWKNRDNLAYAWKVLSRGVCDGCALGVAGFHDWTIKGTHLCMTRLNLLRLNTMRAFDPKLLSDVSHLQSLDNAHLRDLGRLPAPMLREKGEPGFHPLTWEEAYERIAGRIRKSAPRRLAFFVTSRGVTNEVYYMAQKVARFLGTNHVDNAARLCHSPSTGAMKYGLGVAATTCSYKDWYGTDLIVFFGANPANDQPVTTKYLHEAKKLGTKVVLVNPYLEPGMKRYWVPSTLRSALFGTGIADYWFPVAQGGDIAFLYGVLKVLFKNGWQNQTWIDRHAAGLEELKRQIEKLDWAVLEKQSGLSWRSMEEFAELIRDAKNSVLVWSMGITQHAYGGDAVSMILNLGLARGYVGRDKNGLMPIRGHSSVQGGAEMGAYSTVFPGGKAVNAENAQALSEAYGFPVPDWIGLTAPEMVEACARGELDLLYCLGGNFLRTLPEPDYVACAMANVPLRVHQDIILTDQMFIEPKEAVLLLPGKTRYEQEGGGIETTTERRVIFSPEIPRPQDQIGQAKAEWKILRELAAAVYPDREPLLGCQSAQAIRDEIVRIVPIYEGAQNLKATGDAVQYGGPHLCADGHFPTADSKGHFRVVSLPQSPVKVCRGAEDGGPRTVGGGREAEGRGQGAEGEEGRKESRGGERERLIGTSGGHESPGGADRPFVVSTRRGKQFNTLIYAEVDPLTGAQRDAIFMNPEDAAALHVKNRDRVDLVNDLGRYPGRIFLAPIARGNLQIHWPEGNVIIHRDNVDTLGGVPDYNAQVRIEVIRT
jgi:molybdopterin-dependent oxidoreductase alpha subunit